MAYGKDERHIAKSIWELPIPEFDPNDLTHSELANLGATLEEVAAQIEFDESLYFPATRRTFRNALETHPAMVRTNEIVFSMLS